MPTLKEAHTGAVLTLKDARTGSVLLMLPVQEGNTHGALCIAVRQARRQAAMGAWALLTTDERHYLFVGDQGYVACPECGRWMHERRKGQLCAACDEPALRASAGARTTARAGVRKRRRKPAPPDMQLRLPGLEN